MITASAYIRAHPTGNVVTQDHSQGAPEIVIEIGSPGTRKRDETIKRRLYERCAVVEYWIVDPVLDPVRVFRSEGGKYGRPVELSAEADDVLTTPLLTGLELRLARIFA